MHNVLKRTSKYISRKYKWCGLPWHHKPLNFQFARKNKFASIFEKKLLIRFTNKRNIYVSKRIVCLCKCQEEGKQEKIFQFNLLFVKLVCFIKCELLTFFHLFQWSSFFWQLWQHWPIGNAICLVLALLGRQTCTECVTYLDLWSEMIIFG